MDSPKDVHGTARKYYKLFGLDKSISRSFMKKQVLNKLFEIPKKEKETPHFYNFEEDNTHQADILFLPHDVVGKKHMHMPLLLLILLLVILMVSRWNFA